MNVNFLCVCGDSSGNTAVPTYSSPPSLSVPLPLYTPPSLPNLPSLSLQVPPGLDTGKDSSCLADLLSAGNKLFDVKRRASGFVF